MSDYGALSLFGRYKLTVEEWDTTRLMLKSRAGACCEVRSPVCAADKRGELRHLPDSRTALHHRRARSAGGTRDLDVHGLANLLFVCEACHIWLETCERGYAYRRGWLIRHPRPGHATADTDPTRVALITYGGRRLLLHPTSPEYLPDGWDFAA